MREKDDLLAGRTPASSEGLTVKQLANNFLNSTKCLLDCGEIRESTFRDYLDMCTRVVKVFGAGTTVASLRPTDFEILRANFAKAHGPTLYGDITCTRFERGTQWKEFRRGDADYDYFGWEPPLSSTAGYTQLV